MVLRGRGYARRWLGELRRESTWCSGLSAHNGACGQSGRGDCVLAKVLEHTEPMLGLRHTLFGAFNARLTHNSLNRSYLL